MVSFDTSTLKNSALMFSEYINRNNGLKADDFLADLDMKKVKEQDIINNIEYESEECAKILNDKLGVRREEKPDSSITQGQSVTMSVTNFILPKLI